MVPTSTAALTIFLTAIVPGYLTIYLWSRNKTWKGLQNDLQTVIKSITLSAVIQLLLLPYVLVVLYPARDHLDRHPFQITVWLVLLTLLFPYLLGSIAARVTDRLFDPATVYVESLRSSGWKRRIQVLARWITQPAAQPSVWDWAVVADKLDGHYVVVTWNDGKKIAGTFGMHSLGLTTPEQQGLFLETEWLLDEQGDFTQPVANSAGILIPSLTEVRSIRLLRGEMVDDRPQEASEAAIVGADAVKERRAHVEQEPGAAPASAGGEQTSTQGNTHKEKLSRP